MSAPLSSCKQGAACLTDVADASCSSSKRKHAVAEVNSLWQV